MSSKANLYEFKKSPYYLHYVWWSEQIFAKLQENESTNVLEAFIMARQDYIVRDDKRYRIPLRVSVELTAMVTRVAKASVHLKLNWSLHQDKIEIVSNEYNGRVRGLLPDTTLQMSTPPPRVPVEQNPPSSVHQRPQEPS